MGNAQMPSKGCVQMPNRDRKTLEFTVKHGHRYATAKCRYLSFQYGQANIHGHTVLTKDLGITQSRTSGVVARMDRTAKKHEKSCHRCQIVA